MLISVIRCIARDDGRFCVGGFREIFLHAMKFPPKIYSEVFTSFFFEVKNNSFTGSKRRLTFPW